MTISDLVTAILRSAGAPGWESHPLLVGVAGVMLVLAIIWRLIVLLYKLGPGGPQWIHAVAHYKHVRGRNKATEALTAALGKKGNAEQLIRGLREVRQISPMDAPGAHLYLEGQTEAGVLTHRVTPVLETDTPVVIVAPST
jgi:hypothetical protein